MEDLLTKLVDSALACLSRKSHAEAVGYLRKAEEVLEDSATYGVGSFELVLFVLHNLAYCFQQLGETAESASYLDGCVYNLGVRLRAKAPAALRIRLETHMAQACLQLACLLVSLSKSDQASKLCQTALRQLHSLAKLYQRPSTPPALPSFWSAAWVSAERLLQLLDLKRDLVGRRRQAKNRLIRPCSWADLVLIRPLLLDYWKVGSEMVSMDGLCQLLSLSAAVLYLFATIRHSQGHRDAKTIHKRAVLILDEVSENALSSLISKAYISTYAVLDISTENSKPRASSRSPARRGSKAPPLLMKRARSLAPASKSKEVSGFNSLHSEAGRRTRDLQRSSPALS